MELVLHKVKWRRMSFWASSAALILVNLGLCHWHLSVLPKWGHHTLIGVASFVVLGVAAAAVGDDMFTVIV